MRFIVISDTHFFAPGRGTDGVWWNRSLHSRSAEISDCMVETISGFQPDFAIHCGDFTGRGDMENFEAGRAVMDRLGCPWYAVVGNHDTWFPGVRDGYAKLYGLPSERCYYSRSLAGLYFIFLDTCYWRSDDGAVSPYLDKEPSESASLPGLFAPPAEVEWLRAELEAHKADKVILVSHTPLGFKEIYPVTTLPNGEPGRSEGYASDEFIEGLTNRCEVREVLRGYDNIKMALAGHWHINDFHVEDGIAFCQTGAMREYPFEFRVVDVEHDALSVTTHGLNDPAFAQDSFMDERRNYWVAGTDADRTFSVRL